MPVKIILKHKDLLWKLGLFFLLCLPVVLFIFPVIININNLAAEDWDQFFGIYEAIRLSILKYHQFPWWNPWVAGGVPLYANPQAGIISIQTPLVLIFGTIAGLKIAIASYFILGFWGMYLLLGKINQNPLKNALLSYIFIFSGFAVYRLYAGHFNFLVYLLIPFFYYLFLISHKSLANNLLFAFFGALLINSSLHNIVIQAILFYIIALIIFLLRDRKNWKSYCLGLLMLLLLSAPKVLFSYDYINDFKRGVSESLVPAMTVFRALAWPWQSLSDSTGAYFKWYEAGSYVGLILLATVIISLIYTFFKGLKNNYLSLIFFLIAVIAIIISIGSFDKYSPYELISNLPIFKLMQISTRWLGWAIIAIILSIGASRQKKQIVIFLLFLSVIDVFLVNRPLLQKIFIYNVKYPQVDQPFNMYDSFKNTQFSSAASYPAMLQNYGEVRGNEPILNYDSMRPTQRCGINKGCEMVSPNAKITYWSPNKVIIERIDSGPIELNLNPSNYWRVNGKRLFDNYRVVEVNEKFVIEDESKIITCEIVPQLR